MFSIKNVRLQYSFYVKFITAICFLWKIYHCDMFSMLDYHYYMFFKKNYSSDIFPIEKCYCDMFFITNYYCDIFSTDKIKPIHMYIQFL